MIYSRVDFNQYLFIDLHVEQVFNNVFYEEKFPQIKSVENDQSLNESPEIIEKGILGTRTLTNSTIVTLQNFFGTANLEKRVVIISFKNLADIQINQKEKIFQLTEKLIKSNCVLIFEKIDFQIATKARLKEIIAKICENENSVKSISADIIAFANKKNLPNIEGLNESEILRLREEGFGEMFKKFLGRYSINNQAINDGIHTSSPVYLTKYINIKNFLEERSFFPHCLYRLANKIIQSKILNKIGKKARLSLFCHTLNGAYIAAVLSELLCADVSYLDHIGPINKLYETKLATRIISKANYIVVSDVVCLGTELQIAKNLISYGNGQYVGYATIVKVRTTNAVNAAEDLFLFEISKENNPIQYSVYTDLQGN